MTRGTSPGGGQRPEAWRLFVAVELPEAVRDRVTMMADRLARAGWRARWVRPEGTHLTLKFYGNVALERLPRLEDALARATERLSPFELETAEPGAFPNPRRPRVIWLGVSGDLPALQALVAQVERESESAGFPREDRPFRAHLTVGRVRPEDQRTITGAEREFGRLAELPPLALPVDHIMLIRSELRREGAVYSEVRSFPLQGAGR